MNIIFMGTPDFAIPSLNALLNSKHKISAVVTVPDKPKGRGLKLSESAVKGFALKNGLKLLQPVKLREESFVNEIKLMQPELIIVVAFRILPGEVYSIPKYGSVNLHSSLLPRYRGAAPINRVIINGDKETGVTTFFLQDRVDVGNVILQKKCAIDPNDDAGSLHNKLAEIGADVVIATVNLIEETKGKPPVYVQDELLASLAPKIFKQDCKIEWHKPASRLYDFIRGLSPYPGAFSLMGGRTIKIFKTAINEGIYANEPGMIAVSENRIYAACGEGALEILELQMEGKKRMTSNEFLRGNKPDASFEIE